MAKKIKAPTYAERARKILKKYPRSNWDAIERNDMLKELRQLKIEQEATRPLMEIADKANDMDAGVMSPSKGDQTFGPTNPQQGDPRFQKWAENVPGMGGYDIDPRQMNIQGIPQGGVDPRKMSMQQYKADTQFATGGPYVQGDPWNYGMNPNIGDNLGMLSLFDSFNTPDAISKYNRDQDFANRSAQIDRDRFNTRNPLGSYADPTASNQLFQPIEGNWFNMPRKGIQGYNDAMDALPNDSYDKMLQLSNNRKGLTDKWMNDVMDKNPGYNINSPLMKSMLEEKISPFKRASSELRGPAGRDFQSRQPQPAQEQLIAPPPGMNMSGSTPYNVDNFMRPAPKDNLSGFNIPYNPMTAVGGQAPNMVDTLKDVPLAPLEGALDAGPGLGTAAAKGGAKYQVPTTSIAPFLLSAASSVIGDFAQMRNLRNMPQSVDLGRMTSSKVNYEPERQLMTRQANQMANVNAANARNTGMNAANAYANMSAANSGLYDQYGAGIGQSYMKEQNTNAQLAQQANQTNAGLNAQEAIQNMQLKQQQVVGRGQGIASLANTIPQMTKDFGQQVNQDRIVSMMGEDMGMYQQILQNPTFLQKLAKAFNVDPRVIIARLNPGIQGNQTT